MDGRYTLPEGLFGFSYLRDFKLYIEPDSHFGTLESLESDISSPVVDTIQFGGFTNGLNKQDALKLGDGPLMWLTIVTIPDNIEQMTANFKGPLVFNIETREGYQCILTSSMAAIRQPIYSKFKEISERGRLVTT